MLESIELNTSQNRAILYLNLYTNFQSKKINLDFLLNKYRNKRPVYLPAGVQNWRLQQWDTRICYVEIYVDLVLIIGVSHR
jgi:hypothetical protein